jgi:hypothetical protein
MATPSSITPTPAAGAGSGTVTVTTSTSAGSAAPDVLYHDDFTNTGSGWPDEVSFENYYVGYHEPDNYHVEVHVPNDSGIVTVPDRTFDNFSAETQVLVAKANTAPTGDFRYGLAFRRAGKRFYAFTISPRTKTWYVLKSSPTGLQVLGQGTQDSIQGLQALDTLRVNAQGPAMSFYINGQSVGQITDADYAGGQVGFYVETFDSPKVHIHFHNITVSKPENLPVEASAGAPPLYHDDFTDTGSGWPNEVSFENYYVGYHEPDNYHVEVHVPNDNAIVTVPDRTFDNFNAESQVFVAKANTAPTGDFRYGLVFRRAGNHFYAFTISPRTKTWYVLKSNPNGLQVLGQGTQDSIQGLQAPDTLRVNAQGPAMAFYVNGQSVGQITDAEYADGAIGFYVETFDSPKVHIHFHNITINKPENLPAAGALAATCTVTVDLLRLRPEPSLTDQPALAGLFNGTQLDALGRSADSSWLRVQIHGATQTGWVIARTDYISCNVPVAGLPVAGPAPAATSTAVP